MSDSAYGVLDHQAPGDEIYIPPVDAWVEPPQRSILQPVLLVVPLLFAAGGYFGSAPALVDMSFLLLTFLCGIFILNELRNFSERYGIGGLLLYGGVIAWFCYDYFHVWFLGWTHTWPGPFSTDVVAKSATYHMLYIICMSIGIRIRKGAGLPKLINKFPEPSKPADYFFIVVLAQAVGLSAYIFFTKDSLYITLYNSIVAGRGGEAAVRWTVGRTGNLNFSFGAYVAELVKVGTGAALVAAFCMVFIKQSIFKHILCALVWLLGLGLAFGTGARGDIVVVMLPLVFFIFIRYHVQAQSLLKKYSIRAYVIVTTLLAVSIVLFQIQARYRGQGFLHVNFSKVSLSALEGNEMFSTGLLGFMLIPDQQPYFYDSFPGETVVAPIPHFVFWMLIAPAPRALWTSKPVDPSWKWYNAISTNRTTLGGGASEGTTISEGIVGYWYFRFGIAGVIEGGLFMGWLMGILERALYNNGGRPLSFLAVLAISAWMFRTYRDADLQDLADTGVILAGLSLCVLALRLFVGGPRTASAG